MYRMSIWTEFTCSLDLEKYTCTKSESLICYLGEGEEALAYLLNLNTISQR